MKKDYKSLIACTAMTLSLFSGLAQQVQEEGFVKTSQGIVKMDASKNESLANAKSVFQRNLQLTPDNDFVMKSQETDELGFVHQKYQQMYQGVPVEFAKPVMHAKNGNVTSISGEYYDVKDLSVSPAISAQTAFAKALQHTGAQSYLWEDQAASQELGYSQPVGELLVLPVFDANNSVTMKLAYKFDIYTIVPLGGGDLYIDAQDGKALFYNNKVLHVDNFGHDGRAFATITSETPCTEEVVETFDAFVAGTAATRYSGSRTIETTQSGGSYTLNDASRKVYTRDANGLAPVGSSLPYITNYSEFTDNNNNWTAAEYDNANKDNAALDAHWGAMKTYDYWSQVHNRNSYDGNGAQLRSYVHVDNNYDNAFWFLNVMSYGDGSSNGNEGNGFFDALTSLDVAAHEVGHAVTQFTANLAYQRESGGLNEGYSDIWGAAIEHFAKGNGNDAAPAADIWLIGDEIDRRNGSAALRSMSNPKSLGQPDTYGGTNWINPNCGTPTQSNDYCGVHTNSGVLNKWFFLAVAGGSGTNDVGDVYNVSGIGMDKAAKIAYRGVNTYMSANTTFAQARTALIQSAIDLYGAGGAEEQAVTNAMYAVNVGDAFVVTGPPVCNTTVSSFPYNEGFENTLGQWSQGSGDDFDWAINSGGTPSTGTGPSAAGEGTYYLYVESSSPNYPSKNTIINSPCFNLTGVSGATASFKYQMTGSAVGTVLLEAREDGSSTWTQVWTKSGDQGAAWIDETVDLSGYGTVQLRFNATTAASWAGDIAIDAFGIAGGTTADTTAPSVPTSLTVNAVTTTTVDLAWNASSDNVGVTGYDVYQGTTNLGEVAGTSTQITGLTASTAYTFSVRAKDAAGNVSGASNTVNATTSDAPDTQAPSTPTNLSVAGVTTTTVDLSWTASTDNVAVTAYDVFQGTNNLGEVAGTTANITGLAEGTTYQFSVRAKDAAGNVSGNSNTVTATTETTPPPGGCSGGVSTLPYGESYEASLGLWSQSSADDINWTRDANGTPSSNTGPSGGSDGSFYMYVEASGNGTGFPNKRAVLNSPCFDLSGETEATFSFDYHMYGSNDGGSVTLEVSDDSGASWSSLWSQTGNQGNQWNAISVDLSAYLGGSIQLRFNRITGGTWQSDVAIDNVALTAGGGGNDNPPSGYCASNGNNTNDEYIQRVQLGSIDNSTGASAGGYGDFTNLSTNLGSSNTITITPRWTGTIYSEGYAVWVDYNRDGDFGDANELVYSRTATTATPISGTFSVPAGASNGPTRMRVSMKYNGIPTACESFQYGEVEDYIVVIGSSAASLFDGETSEDLLTAGGEEVNTFDFSIYPNPVTRGQLSVQVTGADAERYTIYNMLGQVVSAGTYSSTLNVSRLQAGMYVIEVAVGNEVHTKRFIKK